MTPRELFDRVSTTGIPQRLTSVEIAGAIFYIRAIKTHGKYMVHVENDAINVPEILVDNRSNYSTMNGVVSNIRKQLRGLARAIIEDQKDLPWAAKLVIEMNRMIGESIVGKDFRVEWMNKGKIRFRTMKGDSIHLSTNLFNMDKIKVRDIHRMKFIIPMNIRKKKTRRKK